MIGFRRRLLNFFRSHGLRWLLTHVHRYLDPTAPTTLRCGVTISPDRSIKKWRQISTVGYHERDVDQFIADFLRPGDVVFDIGASIGVLTAIAAKTVQSQGTVHAFEVDEASYANLRGTIDRNKLTNVIANNIALSDKCGEATFVRPASAWGAFMLSVDEGAGEVNSRRAIDVYFLQEEELLYTSRTTTIDDYVRTSALDRLDLIKIDVDGPELAIIKGGLKTIAKFRPAIITEASMFMLDHGATFKKILEFLSS